jgi:transposase
LRHQRTHLTASGTLHPTPEKVQDPLFQSYTFFDPDDALQVKYEMLRRVEREGHSVTETAKAFGFSRRHFYDLQHQFAQHGFQGLVPKKRGPKGAYKLTAEVVDFIEKAGDDLPGPKAAALARQVHERFGLSLHPRSIEKALARKKKDRLPGCPRGGPCAPRRTW